MIQKQRVADRMNFVRKWLQVFSFFWGVTRSYCLFMFCPVRQRILTLGWGGGLGSHLKAQEERVEAQQIGVFIRNET